MINNVNGVNLSPYENIVRIAKPEPVNLSSDYAMAEKEVTNIPTVPTTRVVVDVYSSNGTMLPPSNNLIATV